MKKLLTFFITIFLVSCSNIRDQGRETVIINCPIVYFSSENNTYIDGDNVNFDLEKINYKASLNNYGFKGNCKSDLEYNKFNLELLILTEPINPKNDLVNLPVFVLLYDKDNNLIDKQYFRITDNLKLDTTKLDYEILDIIGDLNILVDLQKKVESMIVGFVKIN